MATEIWINIGSGNGLLHDGNKPLPELMLTDYQWSPVTFILGGGGVGWGEWGEWGWGGVGEWGVSGGSGGWWWCYNYMSKISFKFPRGHWVNIFFLMPNSLSLLGQTNNTPVLIHSDANSLPPRPEKPINTRYIIHTQMVIKCCL